MNIEDAVSKKIKEKKSLSVEEPFKKVKDTLENLGIDTRTMIDLSAPRKIFEVSFINVAKHDVLFTVEHSNKVALKANIADMPVTLQSKKPKLRVVSEPAEAHFQFEEWMELSKLPLPGIWYYFGTPELYAHAVKTYKKIDPLGRVFGGEKPKDKKIVVKKIAK